MLPNNLSTTITDRHVLMDTTGRVCGPDVVLDSGNTDSGSTPTYRFRPGNVIVLRTSTGRFVEANDTNGDRNTAPTITSSSHTDGNGDIVIVGNHGTISVTTTTGSGTEANNATDLNADSEFAAHYIASSAAGELTIAALATGAQEYFYVDATTMATAGFAEGPDNGVSGADADYKVTRAFADLQDDDGTAINQVVGTLDAAYFDESELINLTAEAKAVLTRRGSRWG